MNKNALITSKFVIYFHSFGYLRIAKNPHKIEFGTGTHELWYPSKVLEKISFALNFFWYFEINRTFHILLAFVSQISKILNKLPQNNVQ